METLCGIINNKTRVYKQTCPQTISVNCPLCVLFPNIQHKQQMVLFANKKNTA